MRNLNGKCVFWISLTALVCIWLVLFLMGCTTVSYDRTNGQVRYHRIGGVEFRKLEIVREGDDVLLNIEQYKSEPMAEVAAKCTEAAIETTLKNIKP